VPEKMPESTQIIQQHKTILRQERGSHACDRVGHSFKQLGVITRLVVDVILEGNSYGPEEVFKCAIQVVELIGKAFDGYFAPPAFTIVKF